MDSLLMAILLLETKGKNENDKINYNVFLLSINFLRKNNTKIQFYQQKIYTYLQLQI